MEKRRKSNPTHINGLHEDLVVNILMRLPIQDAVRTSILSRRWRYIWTKLPQLVFDSKFYAESIRNEKSKLIMAIYQVLFLHRGPLLGFELSLSNLGSSYEIDQFVLVVLQKGVKKFTICRPSGEPYRLPSSIFAYSQQLNYLVLRSCVFKTLLEFKGFSNLKRLGLFEAGISGDRFSSLISNCPKLKILWFNSSTKCGHLDIDSPNLNWFCFRGLCESICFKNTPKVRFVQIKTSKGINKNEIEEIEASTKPMFCGRLPVVEELRLDKFYSKYLTANKAPIFLLNDLCHLKYLHLDEVFTALCLIRNFKNLKKLTVYVRSKNEDPDIVKEVEAFSNVTFDHLREVVLSNVSGLKSELEFTKLILAKSSVLERVVIQPESESVGDKGLIFYKELSVSRRASSLVEIVYAKGK